MDEKEDKKPQKSDFSKIFLELVNQLEPNRYKFPTEIPDVLYHYTNAAGLVGILRSNTIWLTDYRYLNDTKELMYTIDVGKDCCRAAISRNKHIMSEFLDRYMYYSFEFSPSYTFIFSLSEDPNSLSQWRGYSEDGQGFSIGFSTKKFSAAAATGKNHFDLKKIIYDDGSLKSKIDLYLLHFENKIQSEIGLHPDQRTQIIDWAAFNFQALLDNMSVQYKHSSFRDEQEWRLTCHLSESGLTAKEILIRLKGKQLSPYAEMGTMDLWESAKKSRLPIERIGIGPGFDHELQRTALGIEALNSGYKPDIYFADTPYRRA